MKVEIWSDIMCPFCYIGKRKFENALSQFEHKDNVEIVWKSFQLNPELTTDSQKNINQYLAEIKGWSVEQAKAMNDRVTDMAKQVGLNYDFDTAVVANSFNAHRLIQFAKKLGKGDVAEERLFKAYFTEGKNVDDTQTLIELGKEIGLNEIETQKILTGTLYSEEVEQDIYEAQQVGVRGVPFFVLGSKYAVSGAQDTAVFLDALNKTWIETHS